MDTAKYCEEDQCLRILCALERDHELTFDLIIPTVIHPLLAQASIARNIRQNRLEPAVLRLAKEYGAKISQGAEFISSSEVKAEQLKELAVLTAIETGGVALRDDCAIGVFNEV